MHGGILYEGFVATNGHMLYNTTASFNQIMSRSQHTAKDDLTSIKLLLSNFRPQIPDAGLGSAATVTASIEYPSGTIQRQVTFNGGSTSGSIPDVGTKISDYVSVSIPKNSNFWIRVYYTNPSGLIYQGALEPGTTEGAVVAISGLSDQTMTGAALTGGTAQTWIMPPLAIIGFTTTPSVLIVGDSRTLDNVQVAQGNVAPSIAAAGVASVNIAFSGETAESFLSDATARSAVYPYGSQVIAALGINDMQANARTPAQAAANVNALLPSFGAPKKWVITIEPYTDSVNHWVSPDDQTLHVGAGGAVDAGAFNDIVRAGLSHANGFYEIADVVMTARNSNHWKVTTVGSDSPPFTGDGLHPNNSGNSLELHSGAIVPASWP